MFSTLCLCLEALPVEDRRKGNSLLDVCSLRVRSLESIPGSRSVCASADFFSCHCEGRRQTTVMSHETTAVREVGSADTWSQGSLYTTVDRKCVRYPFPASTAL